MKRQPLNATQHPDARVTKKSLTNDQRWALQEFADQQGRLWRGSLAHMWECRFAYGKGANGVRGAGEIGEGGYYGTATNPGQLDAVWKLIVESYGIFARDTAHEEQVLAALQRIAIVANSKPLSEYMAEGPRANEGRFDGPERLPIFAEPCKPTDPGAVKNKGGHWVRERRN